MLHFITLQTRWNIARGTLSNYLFVTSVHDSEPQFTERAMAGSVVPTFPKKSKTTIENRHPVCLHRMAATPLISVEWGVDSKTDENSKNRVGDRDHVILWFVVAAEKVGPQRMAPTTEYIASGFLAERKSSFIYRWRGPHTRALFLSLVVLRFEIET